MEDEIDIYADLPNFNLGDNENLAEKNKKITEKCTRLEKQVADLTQSLESLQKVNNNLEVNLSSLLKTAKAEIARKDRMIADIRQQLDNMQFRRGEYSKSAKQGRRSPQRRKRDNSPPKSSYVVEVAEVPDTTEFVCSNPPPSIEEDDNRSQKSSRPQLNGVVNTVFGERLRKRILEEQEEEERQRKEQAKARAEIDTKKINSSSVPEKIAESDSRTEPKAKSPGDPKLNSVPRVTNTGSSLGSSSSLNSQEDVGFTKRNHSDRKRQPEDQPEPTSSHKKLKTDNGKSRYRDTSRHNTLENHSSSKNSSKNRTEEGNYAETSNDLSKYQIIDEYEAPVENEAQNKTESVNAADDDESQYRHNRVAIRLMLLAEGIDPDIEAKKTAQNEQSKVVDDKKQSSKSSGETSRSRSKSRNRRHNHRSRSRTPDERWKKSRESKQRENRDRKRSRDRFERRKESKNKDRDNLSEFSREICDLRERIEHRVEDRSSDRAGKSRSLKRHKRNDEKSHRSERSRTPDSSRCGSKEKTDHRSRGDKQYGRSRSRERHKSSNRRRQQSDLDDVDTKNAKTVEPVSRKTEDVDVEIVPAKASVSQIPKDPETKSLISLEDGEIPDSPSSSPIKTVDAAQCVTEKALPSRCKLNLLDSEGTVSNIGDMKCSLPLREIGNSQNNQKSVFVEKPMSSISESIESTGLNNSLNTSREERIENIAEFIANFSSDVSESKKVETLNDQVIPHENAGVDVQPTAVVSEEKVQNEKLRFILNTVFQGSSSDPLVSPLTEISESVCAKKVNGHGEDEDWCLIAIDSPVKNFDENRKSRMMAQSLQNTENPEPPEILQPGDPSLEDLKNSSGTTHVDDSPKKIHAKVEKVASLDGTTKPTAQPIKNISKPKPPVLTSLRSTYRRRKREIILSDANSEQCTKISVPNQANQATENLRFESKSGQQSGDDINKPLGSDDVGPIESERCPPEVVDLNCNNSKKCDKKKSIIDLFGDEYDTENTADCEESATDDQLDVAAKEKAADPPIDETSKKHEKSTAKTSKTEKEMTKEIDGSSMKSELCNSVIEESESKRVTVCRETDSLNTIETDVIENVGSKSKTVCKLDKTEDENEESSNKKSLEIKPAKSVTKAKIDGSNSKPKKEPQKLVVIARRRKPVNLEDSSSPSSVAMNPSSIHDSANNSVQSTNGDLEASNSVETNCE